MTAAAACGWSLVRSLAVAFVAWPLCRRQAVWLWGLDERSRRLAWFALAIPFLCPELWTGYAWSGFALRVAGSDFWSLFPKAFFPSPTAIVARDAAVDELLLDLLLFFRALPVGTLAFFFAPPAPLSAEALYCRELALGNGPYRGPGYRAKSEAGKRGKNPAPRTSPFLRGWLAFALRGKWHAALPAIGLMFLVSFQEFELASLIGRPAWTVWLFDAQVGGLALHESLRLTLLPVGLQIAVLLPIAWWVMTSRPSPSLRESAPGALERQGHRQWGLLIAAITVVFAIPALMVGRGTLDGLARVLHSAGQRNLLLKEIFVGCGYALTAAIISAVAAARLLQRARGSRLARLAIAAVALPGLFGSLVLGLALIELFQQPYLHLLYKTPLALAAGLVLFLFPRAIVLRLLLWSSRRHAGLHLAELLSKSPSKAGRDAARELAWQLQGRGEFWSMALLAYWAFLELTVAYLLAPVTIVSAPVMLYNQMHFGRNATLSALVFLTVTIPALVFLLALSSRRFLFRWFWR